MGETDLTAEAERRWFFGAAEDDSPPREPEESLPPTRTGWVEDQLREAIFQGELLPGERLAVGALAKRFNVSLTPVREALQRLGAQGLIEVVPQRGARVALISEGEARELYEVRLLVEPQAVRLSVQEGARRSDGSWNASLVRRMRDLEEKYLWRDRNPGGYALSQHRMHLALVMLCPSVRLRRLSETLIDHSVRFQTLTRTDVSPEEGYGRLIEAALGGDADRAEAALRRRLQDALVTIHTRGAAVAKGSGEEGRSARKPRKASEAAQVAVPKKQSSA